MRKIKLWLAKKAFDYVLKRITFNVAVNGRSIYCERCNEAPGFKRLIGGAECNAYGCEVDISFIKYDTL